MIGRQAIDDIDPDHAAAQGEQRDVVAVGRAGNALVAAHEAAAMDENEDGPLLARFLRRKDVEAVALVRAVGEVTRQAHAAIGLALLLVAIERLGQLQSRGIEFPAGRTKLDGDRGEIRLPVSIHRRGTPAKGGKLAAFAHRT